MKTDLKKPEELRHNGPNTNFEICKYLEEIFFSVTLDLFGDPHWADPYLASVLGNCIVAEHPERKCKGTGKALPVMSYLAAKQIKQWLTKINAISNTTNLS